jgi:prephenate dehydrogenase
MEDIHIGIIGGTGGMGRIFADLFRREGYTVHVAGRTAGLDIPAMAKKCMVIIVSVPIGITVKIIEEVGPLMREDALLMDLTSLKAEPIRAMLRSAPAEVIGLHPLFGPGVDSVAGHTICVCPARAERWLGWVRDILKKYGAIVVETTPERHDEMMALVQAMNHLNSITMGMIIKEWGVDPAELEKFTTPIFTTKLSIIKELFTNNPRLYADIITLNPSINKILDLYGKTLSEVTSAIKQGDAETFTELMETRSLWRL